MNKIAGSVIRDVRMNAFSIVKKLKKYSFLLVSLIFTAAVSAVVTWSINTTLGDNSETKVFEYVFEGRSDSLNLSTVRCWDGDVLTRSDSMKCSGDDHIIRSPCFVHVQTKTVKCPNDPSDTSSENIFTYHSIDTSSISTRESRRYGTYWYIKLSGNDRCRYINGATETVANKRFDYACDSGKKLYLPIDTDKSPHTISCYENSRLSQCKIKELWG